MLFFTKLLKRIIPYALRLHYRLLKRWLTDVHHLTIFNFAKNKKTNFFIEKNNYIEIKQPILYTPQSAAKIVNIEISASLINTTMVQPNQIFSFWHIVGKPTAAKGYQKGRNIIDGKLTEDVGGGLCQLASILYHTALVAGLQITERYNHSVDIYTQDSERFTPLGADATVVFGFKDLRFRNHLAFPIAFEIQVINDILVCRLWASAKITPKTLTFKVVDVEKQQLKTKIQVETWSEGERIEVSFYSK